MWCHASKSEWWACDLDNSWTEDKEVNRGECYFVQSFARHTVISGSINSLTANGREGGIRTPGLLLFWNPFSLFRGRFFERAHLEREKGPCKAGALPLRHSQMNSLGTCSGPGRCRCATAMAGCPSQGSREDRTPISGFRVLCTNHYTMKPLVT